MLIPTDVLVRALLANEIDATPLPGFLSDLEAILYTNSPTLTRDTAIGDLTQPTYTGYAAVAIVPSAIYYDEETGGYAINTQALEFRPTANPASPVTIVGWGLQNPTGPVLYAAEDFDAPQILTDTDSLIDIIGQIILGAVEGSWGQVTIVE